MNLTKNRIIRNKQYYKKRLQIILSYLTISQNSILDLGCGEMLLLDLLPKKISGYTGVDQISFFESKEFVQADLLEIGLKRVLQADFVFILGVLDHLDNMQKEKLLMLWKDSFKNTIIISQKNPKSLLLYFSQSKRSVISIIDYFLTNRINKLFLLKFPFSGMVINLTEWKSLRSFLSTEIIYIISKDPE